MAAARFAATSKAAAVGAEWAKSGKWAPKNVARAMQKGRSTDPKKTVLVKRSSAARTFMYSEGAHQRHMLVDEDMNHTLVEMTPEKMVEVMASQSPSLEHGPWHYYTASCDDAFGKEQNALLWPDRWHDLIRDAQLSELIGMPQALPSVWIGGAGTTTAAHYDVMDNAFVQLHGRKRFRLWGADALANLQVYPDLHPRARKTQLDIATATATAADKATEIVLNPGDVIHIPAFTFHQVEALDMSVSMNVFSVCRSQLHGSRILSVPVPAKANAPINLDSMPSSSGKILARVSLEVLPMFGVESVAHFVEHILLDNRYRPLVQRGDKTSDNYSQSSTSVIKDDVTTVIEKTSMQMLKSTIDSAKAELSQDALWKGYRDIIAAHLLESWALQLSGNPTSVYKTLEDAADFLKEYASTPHA